MSRPPRPARLRLRSLEDRLAPATDVLSFHGDLASTGVIATESVLTPANVAVGQFGKLFGVGLDGQVYAQPLVKTGVTIAAGPHTTPGAAGVHDVVFVATQHDSVYAISTADGTVLWHRSFLDPTNPANNSLGASSITPVPSDDTGSPDINPEVGITGTPVIDPATGTLFVVAKTRATVGSTAHYVQRLHALNITDGTDRTAPFLLGDSVLPNVNNTPIYAYGTGDGAVTDPYHGTGRQVTQFHALRGHQRAALSLMNGKVHVAWASHGDNGPYHGWVVAINVSNLAGGMTLAGVLNTSPNDSANGIWQSGGKLVFETDGSAFYFETGNGSGGNPVLNAQGFPEDGNYNEALVKVVADPTTTPANQNINGWGLKVADFFVPYNAVALDGADTDFGSGAPILLPDSAGIPGHPRLIIAGGKEGKFYVFDRDDLGGFDPQNDRALNSVPDGLGRLTPPRQVVGGLFGTPAWYNGRLFAVGALSGPAYSFNLGSDGHLTTTSETAIGSFGGLPGSPIISSDGTNNGIVWIPDRARNRLHAYDAATLATELWHSDMRAGGLDTLGPVVKFAVPTIANGRVFVGTGNGLTAYGQFLPPTDAPLAPTLAAQALSGSSINLTWSDTTPERNLPTSYAIEQSLDGTNFTQVTTAPAGATSLAVGGLQEETRYYFRIRGVNAVGSSPASNVVDATTTTLDPPIDYSDGFTADGLTLNGSAQISGTRLELSNDLFETGSAFATEAIDITGFSSRFTFQLTNAEADGFTFTIQGNAPTALGAGGGDLGFGNVGNSVAVKFDFFDNAGEGYSSTGLYTNGEHPFHAGAINLLPSGIDLRSGHVFRADVDYNGTTLTVTITDTETNAMATQVYEVNIPQLVGGNSAYVGFTGGSGGLPAVQEIVDWVYAPGALFSPNAPTGLGAVPASGTSVRLTWTANATNQTGYRLDRATDAGFTANLLTLVLPAAGTGFTDTAAGLVPSGTYYYRLRAFNSAGDSGNSNVAQVTIPVAPPTPTNQKVEGVTTTTIELSWQDNAGHQADGYKIFRAANRGVFTQVASLPLTSRTPPSTYEWTDEGLTPGTFYEYHIVAFNVSGNNDFAGTNATTITIPPTGVSAVPDLGVINLSWTAPAGAVSFNVYRGTSPGGQGSTPVATGLTSPSYADTDVTGGTTYYYTVTAVNANAARVPPLPAESAPSVEVAGSLAAPPAPTSLSAASAVNTGTPAITLTWAPTAATASYNVYRSLSSNQPGEQVATGLTGPTFTDTDVVFATTYFYRVSAVNPIGESPRSAEVRATPLFKANVNFTSPTGDAVPGYLADTGVIYGSRGAGLSYGWTRNDTARGFDRDAANSPDERHDSFHDMRAAAWRIAVPNGTYRVHVLAGDPLSTTGNYRINVSPASVGGVAAIRGKPTAADPWVDNTVTVTVTRGALWVRNAVPGVNRLAAVEIEQVLPGVDRANGFAGVTGLRRNGSAVIRTGALRLTGNVRHQSGSAFTTAALNVADFRTSFDFRQSGAADGFAFVIQGVGPRARGLAGEGLGYAGIGKSVAVKFDLFDNPGAVGSSSTGLYTNGELPSAAGSVDLAPAGIDLRAGRLMHADIDYTGGVLTLSLRDKVTGAMATQAFAVDIVGTVGGTAFVGFTGGTSNQTAVQDILNWTYTPRP